VDERHFVSKYNGERLGLGGALTSGFKGGKNFKKVMIRDGSPWQWEVGKPIQG